MNKKTKDKLRAFLRFLKEYDAYASFMKNLRHAIDNQEWFTNQGQSCFSIYDFFQKNHYNCWLANAFDWRRTTERFTYWCDLDEEWQSSL